MKSKRIDSGVNQVIETLIKSEKQALDFGDFLQKAKGGAHKYIKREGGPGNYRYIYTDTKQGQPTGQASQEKKKDDKPSQKPKDPDFDAKNAQLKNLYHAINEDIMSSYDGDFENWLEHGESSPSDSVTAAMKQISEKFGEKEAEHIYDLAMKHTTKQHGSKGDDEKSYSIDTGGRSDPIDEIGHYLMDIKGMKIESTYDPETETTTFSDDQGKVEITPEDDLHVVMKDFLKKRGMDIKHDPDHDLFRISSSAKSGVAQKVKE